MLAGHVRFFCGCVALVVSFVQEGLHGAWVVFWCFASCLFPASVGVFCVVCVHCMGGQERVKVSIIIHGHGVLC